MIRLNIIQPNSTSYRKSLSLIAILSIIFLIIFVFVFSSKFGIYISLVLLSLSVIFSFFTKSYIRIGYIEIIHQELKVFINSTKNSYKLREIKNFQIEIYGIEGEIISFQNMATSTGISNYLMFSFDNINFSYQIQLDEVSYKKIVVLQDKLKNSGIYLFIKK